MEKKKKRLVLGPQTGLGPAPDVSGSAPSNGNKTQRVGLVAALPARFVDQQASVPLDPCLSLSSKREVQLHRSNDAAPVDIHSTAQLNSLLCEQVRLAARSHDRWARAAKAGWIRSLMAELGPKDRAKLLKKQRSMQSVDSDDHHVRWELSADFASEVIRLWFSRPGCTTESVIEKSKLFGHTDLRSGIVLRGRCVEQLATSANVTVDELVVMVGQLSAGAQKQGEGEVQAQGAKDEEAGPAVRSEARADLKEGANEPVRGIERNGKGPALGEALVEAGEEAGAKAVEARTRVAAVGAASEAARSLPQVSMYRVERENYFHTQANTRAPLKDLREELRARVLSGEGGCGALNSTFDFSEDSRGGVPNARVPLLDSFWEVLDDASFVLDEAQIRLNSRLYLIWKLQGYVTPYHQDVHVPPHLTLYNQIAGFSTFHFLPLLVGLYATHVGRTHGADALEALLTQLEARGIGALTTIGPKQMLLILPFGAHGVYVPRVAHNPQLEARKVPCDFSIIRAAEMYAWPVCEHYEKELARDDWNFVIELTPEEASKEEAVSSRFAEVQRQVCMELSLSREDWLYHAAGLNRQWEQKQPPEQASDDEG